MQHYIEFDVRTIIMLEKLLGLGFFDTIAGHLALIKSLFFILGKGGGGGV